MPCDIFTNTMCEDWPWHIVWNDCRNKQIVMEIVVIVPRALE